MPLLGSELVPATISPLNRLDTKDLKPGISFGGVLRWIQDKVARGNFGPELGLFSNQPDAPNRKSVVQ